MTRSCDIRTGSGCTPSIGFCAVMPKSCSTPQTHAPVSPRARRANRSSCGLTNRKRSTPKRHGCCSFHSRSRCNTCGGRYHRHPHRRSCDPQRLPCWHIRNSCTAHSAKLNCRPFRSCAAAWLSRIRRRRPCAHSAAVYNPHFDARRLNPHVGRRCT